MLRILHAICKRCGRVLLDPSERIEYLKKIRAPYDRRIRALLAKKIVDLAKKKRKCPYCGCQQGKVKKMTGAFKLVHELKHKDAQREREDFLREFSKVSEENKALKDNLSKLQEDLSPLDVLALLKKVPDDDCDLLNLDAHTRPEDLIITQFLVPPVCIRPSVPMGSSGSNEDDLTTKIGDIVFINIFLHNAFEKGTQTAVTRPSPAARTCLPDRGRSSSFVVLPVPCCVVVRR
jgi:DNA-directed RNA polymerase III subunit RPC1